MAADEYVGSDMWRRDVNDASEAFQVTQEWVSPSSVYVEAKAGTGSRYVVTAMGLINVAEVQVTVLQPWQNAWMLHRGARVELGYVMEHFADRYRSGSGEPQHGGDLKAVEMLINHAMGVVNDLAHGAWVQTYPA